MFSQILDFTLLEKENKLVKPEHFSDHFFSYIQISSSALFLDTINLFFATRGTQVANSHTSEYLNIWLSERNNKYYDVRVL
jgi:hypothetical protein